MVSYYRRRKRRGETESPPQEKRKGLSSKWRGEEKLRVYTSKKSSPPLSYLFLSHRKRGFFLPGESSLWGVDLFSFFWGRRGKGNLSSPSKKKEKERFSSGLG